MPRFIVTWFDSEEQETHEEAVEAPTAEEVWRAARKIDPTAIVSEV